MSAAMPEAPRRAPRAAALAALLAGLLLAAAPAGADRVMAALRAAAPEGPAPGVERLRILPGWREPDGRRVAAVELVLAPGWHTYWRAPGGAGLPPRFDWSGSRNLGAVSLEWPRPRVLDVYGGPTLGYPDALVLPVVLTPADPAAPVEIELDLFFGVCKEICIPTEARLAARVEPGAEAQGRAAIERALAERPLAPEEAGVTGARCRLEIGADGPLIAVEVAFAEPPARAPVTAIEAEAEPELWIGAAETEVAGGSVHARARLAAGAALERGALRVTLVEEHRAIDIRGCRRR